MRAVSARSAQRTPNTPQPRSEPRAVTDATRAAAGTALKVTQCAEPACAPAEHWDARYAGWLETKHPVSLKKLRSCGRTATECGAESWLTCCRPSEEAQAGYVVSGGRAALSVESRQSAARTSAEELKMYAVYNPELRPPQLSKNPIRAKSAGNAGRASSARHNTWFSPACSALAVRARAGVVAAAPTRTLAPEQGAVGLKNHAYGAVEELCQTV